MPYKALLNQKIEQSNLSIKKIAEKCKEYGQNITAAYISTLKNNEDKIPSDEVSKALAYALDIDENLLIIESYIDKAPKEFIDFINKIRAILIQSILLMFENSLNNEQLKQFEENLNALPLAEFVVQMKSYSLDNISKSKNSIKSQTYLDEEKMQFYAEFKEPPSFDVTDDSMEPTLPIKSKATIESLALNEYKNGDILYIVKDKKTLFRKCYFVDENRSIINLIALNQKYEMQTLKVKDITIFGKIKRVIISFD